MRGRGRGTDRNALHQSLREAFQLSEKLAGAIYTLWMVFHLSAHYARRLCVVLAALSVTVAKAAPTCPDRPIKLAFFESPVLYIQGSGLDKDFVDELQRRSGCRFTTEVMPRARVWKDLEHGLLDMTTSVLPTPEREASLWIVNYFQLRSYVLLLKAQTDTLKSPEDFLAGPQTLTFGRVRGYKYGAALDSWIDKLEAQERVHDVTKTEQLYRMLAQGRIAAISASPMIYKQALAQYGLTDKVTIADWGGPTANSPRGLGLSKRSFSEAQAREWRALVEDIRRDGTMRRLISKYMDARETEAMLLPREQQK